MVKKKEAHSTTEFATIAGILLGGLSFFFYIWNLKIKPSSTVLTVAVGTALAALIPTLVALWVSSYSVQARMTIMDFISKSRLRHYRLLNDHFFRAELTVKFGPPRVAGDSVFYRPSDFLKVNETFSKSKIERSQMYRQAGLHLDKDYGEGTIKKMADIEARVENQNKKSEELDGLLYKAFKDKTKIRLLDIKESDDKVSLPFLYLYSLSAYVAGFWYQLQNSQNEVRASLRNYIKDRAQNLGDQHVNGIIQLWGAPVLGKEDKDTETILEDVINLIIEIGEDENLLRKLYELSKAHIELDEEFKELQRRVEEIRYKIAGEVYYTTAQCCPYNKATL